MSKFLDENGLSYFWNKIKVKLKTVAFTGSYNDLTDTPTIPEGATVDSALNSSSTNPVQNKAINSALATKVTSAQAIQAVSSAGYATSANASAIASSLISAGGYVTSTYVAGATVASAGNATNLNGSAASAYAKTDHTHSQIEATSGTSNLFVKVNPSTGNIAVNTNLAPASNNSYTLGLSANKWSTVYATTFSGNATTATSATNVAGTAGTSTLSWNTEVTLYTVGGNEIKAKLPANPNTNTTYTFATGDSNGQIKVTPSSGDAYNVDVAGLGTAAYTSTGAFAAATHTHSYLPLSGGTVTGNVTISGLFTVPNYRGTDSIFCRSTTSNTVSGGTERVIRMNAQTNGNMGIYDISYNKWMLRADAAGNIYMSGTANNATTWGGYTNEITTDNTSDTWLLVAKNEAIQHRRMATLSVGTAASCTGNAANVTGTVAIANGGTGATTRLAAFKALNNENVSTNATHFIGLKSDWSKCGYFSIAECKTLLGLGTAAYTASTAYAAADHTHSNYLTSHQSLANYVTLNSAQTITGTKSFSDAIYLTPNWHSSVCLKAQSYTYKASSPATPSTSIWNGVWLQDKSGNTIGYVQVQFSSSGNTFCELNANSPKSGGSNLYIRLYHNNAGTLKTFRPETTNLITLGHSDNRWKQYFGSSSDSISSDERIKQQITSIPDEILDAWGDIQWYQYKMNDSVAEKGTEKARFHTGLITQRIQTIFQQHNLDASKYGFWCYDSWEAEPAEYNDKGEIITKAKKAGDEYSLRYEEALCLEAAYQRRRADRAEARISALEQRLNKLEEVLVTLGDHSNAS